MSAYQEFSEHIGQINDLCCVINLLTWDSRTQMPPGGNESRGVQLGTVARMAQELFAGERTARLLDAAEAEVNGENPDSTRVRSVRQAREAYELTRRVPVQLVADLNVLKSVSQQVWDEARSSNDFAHFRPSLERMIAAVREVAERIGYQEHPYDAMLLRYEPGMTAARLKSIFAELKPTILPILRRAQAQGAPRMDFLTRDYSEEGQRQFALEMVQKFGYDLNRGRLDRSSHPFEISFTRNDVRLTTRYDRHFLPQALFGTLHEAGHAMYEQNVDPALVRTALTTDLLDLYAVAGVSYGAHESQSRLWENLVGRSRGFWQTNFARLQAVFPGRLEDVSAEEFYRAVNSVQPSLIRVEADEVSYNLHIMLRVEIEMGLMDGSIAVKDLPEIWNNKMQEYLGVVPPNDANGVLQDIHWSSGYIGSFPAYTIGNIMSAQFYAAARRALPGLDGAMAGGDYRSLFGWLCENVYRHGRTFSASELLQRSTGRELDTADYRAYIETKFGELFPA